MDIRSAAPLLALVLAACGGSGGPAAGPSPSTAATSASPTPTPAPTEVRRTGPPSVQWRPISVTLHAEQCPSPAPTTQPHPDDTALVPTSESCLDLYEAELTVAKVRAVEVLAKRPDAHLVNVRLLPESVSALSAMLRKHAPKKTHVAIVFAGRAIYTPVIGSDQTDGTFLVGIFTTKAEADKLAAEMRRALV